MYVADSYLIYLLDYFSSAFYKLPWGLVSEHPDNLFELQKVMMRWVKCWCGHRWETKKNHLCGLKGAIVYDDGVTATVYFVGILILLLVINVLIFSLEVILANC